MKFSGSHSDGSGNSSSPGGLLAPDLGYAFALDRSDSRQGGGTLGTARLFARAAAAFLVQRAFGMDADSCRALIRYAIGRPIFIPFVFTPAPSERLSIRRPKTKLAPPFITPREEGGAIFFPPA